MGQPNYIHYVHSFRGFAIINVVIIHAMVWAMMLPSYYSPNPQSWLFIVNEALFHDSTLYFAVISGLLYATVLRPKGMRTFYKSKINNVLIPYIFCSIVFSVFTGAWGWQDSSFMQATPMFIEPNEYPTLLTNNLLWGEAQITYWYIPILLVLYLFTPLFDVVVFNPRYKPVMWLLMALPLVVTRLPFDPSQHMASINGVIYFAGAYVIGMFIGTQLDVIMAFTERYRMALSGFALLMTVTLIYLKSQPIFTIGITTPEESLFFLQKISLSVLVLYVFKQCGQWLAKPLKPFADHAFGIYFLHLFFLNLFLFPGIAMAKETHLSTPILLLSGLTFFAGTIGCSLVVLKTTKLLFGNRSRLLFGS